MSKVDCQRVDETNERLLKLYVLIQFPVLKLCESISPYKEINYFNSLNHTLLPLTIEKFFGTN